MPKSNRAAPVAAIPKPSGGECGAGRGTVSAVAAAHAAVVDLHRELHARVRPWYQRAQVEADEEAGVGRGRVDKLPYRSQKRDALRQLV